MQCFSCHQFMRQAVINEHLDRCLRGDSSIPEPPRSFLVHKLGIFGLEDMGSSGRQERIKNYILF